MGYGILRYVICALRYATRHSYNARLPRQAAPYNCTCNWYRCTGPTALCAARPFAIPPKGGKRGVLGGKAALLPAPP